MGDSMSIRIQYADEVAHALREMYNPESAIREIHFYEQAAELGGEHGNHAVRYAIAPALAQCKIKGLKVSFRFCNLSKESVYLLARAVEYNTCMGVFECERNAYNHPNHRGPVDDDPKMHEIVKQAIISSRAPITEWNSMRLPPDVVEARQKLAEERAAAARPAEERAAAKLLAEERAVAEHLAIANLLEITQLFVALGLDEAEAKAHVDALAQHGFTSLQRLAFVEEADVDECRIQGFSKRVVLAAKASLVVTLPQPVRLSLRQPSSLSPSTMMMTASEAAEAARMSVGRLRDDLVLPDLPSGTAFYAFMSHNWGTAGPNSNHSRVKRLVDWFESRNARMWFDDDRLTRNVASQITRGMDACATVVVFITKAYLEKVDGGAERLETDWCYYEFNYAINRMKRRIIPVVMEEDMRFPSNWTGPVSAHLGLPLFIDYTAEEKFEQCCKELANAIADKINKWKSPDPRLSKMLLSAERYGCVKSCLTVCAILDEPDVFIRPSPSGGDDKKLQADHARKSFSQPGTAGSRGDHLALLAVYNAWRDAGFSKHWCREFFVNERSMSRARDVRDQLDALCDRVELSQADDNHNHNCAEDEPDDVRIRKAVTSGYFYQVCRLSGGNGNGGGALATGQEASYVTIKTKMTVFVHPSSCIFARTRGAPRPSTTTTTTTSPPPPPPPKFLLYHDLVLTTREYMRSVVEIEPSWLNEIAPHYYRGGEKELTGT